MDNEIVLRVIAVRKSPEELNRFIEEYKPFIASCVQKYTGRFVEYGRDDELSIGLLAFHEAIHSYNEEKGNFFTFANQVIKRRLIDYYRKQKKFRIETSIESTMTDGEEDTYDYSVQESIEQYTKTELQNIRKLELQELKSELEKWNISFFDVAQASPKWQRTRKLYVDIIRYIANDKSMIEVMKQKRYLPIAKICSQLKVNRKKVERGRNYIIAGVLIMTGDYEYIRDFIDWG